MRRWLYLAYGIFSALITCGTVAYLVGFLGNFGVLKSIDHNTFDDVGNAVVGALINLFGGDSRLLTVNSESLSRLIPQDLLLLFLFGMQHSFMAREKFKAWWTRHIPQPIERSTYSLAASLMMIILFWFWVPIPDVVWSVDNAGYEGLLNLVFGLGWVIMISSILSMAPADLLGVRQVLCYFRGIECRPLGFRKPGFYGLVRHPIMSGFLLAFWAAPVMTIGRLLFAIVMTLYILIGIAFEERALVRLYGDVYRTYQKDVAMLIPFMTGKFKRKYRKRWSPVDDLMK